MAALKVMFLLCCAVWVCDATTVDEGKTKHTPVAVAVALAEEAGTVEDGQRDKRFYPYFPPYRYPYPSNYRDITPEEWEAARRWMERRFRDDSTFLDTAGSQTSDVVDRPLPRDYPPPPLWYYGDYHPYYSYLRWYRGPHPHPDWDHSDGYCNYPYPHIHPFWAFPGRQRGQEGFKGSERGQGFGGGDKGGEGLGEFDVNQKGFENDRSFQVTVNDKSHQGPGRDRNNQGFGETRGTGFSGSDRGQGSFSGNGRQGFSGQQGFVSSQQGFSGTKDQSPTFDSFPHGDRPSQSGQFGADNFPLSGQDGTFDGRRPGPQDTRGGDSFSMGSGSIPLTNGGGASFSAGASRGPGLFNVGSNNAASAGGSTLLSSNAPNSFSVGASNNFGPSGSFDSSIPAAFGAGSPGSPDTTSSFASGRPTGSSTANRVTLSSSLTTAGDPLSTFPAGSAVGGSANLQGPGSTSEGFSGLGGNVRNRNPQKDALDAKNTIKRETEAEDSPAVQSTASSTT